MDESTRQAFEWASNQIHRSVAATSNQDSVIANLRRNLDARTHVLECIANMQITDTTDKCEVLDLCLSMARLEMEKIGAKCSAAGK